jgi:flagellar motor protein MotB
MARDKKPPDPPADIPAWFMTYSDVITLLMTFFILLLTFATTEPERFEKSVSSTFSKGAATGTTGKKMDGNNNDSFVNRLRPPAARIAMRGAEMPPIVREPAKATFGEGLKSLDEDEQKQNELTSHSFEIPAVRLFDSAGQLTSYGKLICQMLSQQLSELPFHASIQFCDQKHAAALADMMAYLFDTEKTRPGQVAISLVKADGLGSENIRVLIKRFSGNTR